VLLPYNIGTSYLGRVVEVMAGDVLCKLRQHPPSHSTVQVKDPGKAKVLEAEVPPKSKALLTIP
jgi:hypothetical protein